MSLKTLFYKQSFGRPFAAPLTLLFFQFKERYMTLLYGATVVLAIEIKKMLDQ